MSVHSYIIRNEFGAFCSVCQSNLSIEEDDWDTCDTCGGEGFGDDEDDFSEHDDFEFIAKAQPSPSDTGAMG